MSYGVLFVTDGAIAVLGVMLCVWLRPASPLVAGMVILLFVLSGTLGLLGDVAMVGAAQVFRDGSAMFSPGLAGAFLNGLNISTNWVSAASIFPGGIAALMILAPVCVFSLLSQDSLALNLAMIGAAVILPTLCIAWLVWTLQEMKKTPPRSRGESRFASE